MSAPAADLEQPTGHAPIVIGLDEDAADVVRLELRALATYGRHVALARAAVRRTPDDEDRREHFAAFVETLLAWCDDLEAVCDREGEALNAELAAHQKPPATPDAKAIRLDARAQWLGDVAGKVVPHLRAFAALDNHDDGIALARTAVTRIDRERAALLAEADRIEAIANAALTRARSSKT